MVWLRTLPSGDAGVAPEDIAADTWLTAASKIADFRGSSGDFAGWLFGIARLQARNVERRSTRRMTSPVGAETIELKHPLPRARRRPVGRSRTAGSRWLLSHLPERERQVVACIDVVGLDVASTAAALGMKATAVRVARHRGLTTAPLAGRRAQSLTAATRHRFERCTVLGDQRAWAVVLVEGDLHGPAAGHHPVAVADLGLEGHRRRPDVRHARPHVVRLGAEVHLSEVVDLGAGDDQFHVPVRRAASRKQSMSRFVVASCT